MQGLCLYSFKKFFYVIWKYPLPVTFLQDILRTQFYMSTALQNNQTGHVLYRDANFQILI